MSVVKSFILLVTACFFCIGCSKAQRCDRPEYVFILLSENFGVKTENNITYYSVNIGNSIESFYPVNQEGFMSSAPTSDPIKISTIAELRELELEIFKCEVSAGDKVGKIYVDKNVNYIFKNIYLVKISENTKEFIRVKWEDYIE